MQSAMTRFPWFAPLLALYPLLYIAVVNPGQTEPTSVAIVAVVAIAAAFALLVILRSALSTWNRAGIGVAWSSLLFYAYGPVNGWWLESVLARIEQEAAKPDWMASNPQMLQSTLWLLLLLLGFVALRRLHDTAVNRVTGAANLTSFLLMGLLLVQLAVHAAGGQAAERPAPGTKASIQAQAPAATPDIYYIILDGYARADTLAKYYHYDNAPFLDGLRARGFQVSEASHSNYYWTFLSLASSLNFDYMQPMLGAALDPAGTDRNSAYKLLRHNRAADFLRARGYRFVQLQSTWGGTGTNPFADEFIPCNSGLFESEYLRAIADASWLRALNARASMDVANCHLHNLDTLAGQAQKPGPKFVFAHFVPPHHPYLFDREGHVLRRANLSDQFEFQKRLWEEREPYRDQLIYMNGRITAVVDRLIAESARPPIIILQSDHGPNLRTGLRLPEQRRIRMSNFAAFHLPDAPAGLMPDDATPVNQFRRIFNHYFTAGLPLLPERYYASSYLRPYEFVEVDTNGVELAPAAR